MRYCTVGNDFNNDGVRKKNILWFFEVIFFVILCETEGTYIHLMSCAPMLLKYLLWTMIVGLSIFSPLGLKIASMGDKMGRELLHIRDNETFPMIRTLCHKNL